MPYYWKNKKQQLGKKKKRHDIEVGKGKIKLSLFSDDKCTNTTTLKTAGVKKLNTIAEYKMIIQNLLCFYTQIKNYRKDLREHLQLYQKEYQEINWTKEVKDLYLENC